MFKLAYLLRPCYSQSHALKSIIVPFSKQFCTRKDVPSVDIPTTQPVLERINQNSTPSAEHTSHSQYGDTDEAEKFRRLSKEWWSYSGEFRALHDLNRLRVPWISESLRPIGAPQELSLEGLRVLDVGCGGGLLCEPLGRLGASVVGVDAVLENTIAAREHLLATMRISPRDSRLTERVEYRHCSAQELLPAEANSFDAVIASELLEHVSNWQELVADLAKLLKPGGSLFVTTLNRTTLSYYLGIVAVENVLGILPRGTHDWNKFITPADLIFCMELNGMNPQLVHGMWYNLLTRSWSWTSDTSINYAVHAVKCEATSTMTNAKSHTRNESVSRN